MRERGREGGREGRRERGREGGRSEGEGGREGGVRENSLIVPVFNCLLIQNKLRNTNTRLRAVTRLLQDLQACTLYVGKCTNYATRNIQHYTCTIM